jgi:hypothetical protein
MPEGPPYKSAADVPRGTPTPTQDELNRIALGEHIDKLADDGSGPDPTTRGNEEAQRTMARQGQSERRQERLTPPQTTTHRSTT